MAYCSVPTHGRALVESLAGGGPAGRLPATSAHRGQPPRRGRGRRRAAGPVRDGRHARDGGHTVDTDRPLAEAFAEADLLITDVSSLAVEWLPTGRPLIVTVPAEAGAVVTASPLLDAGAPADRPPRPARAGELARRCLADDPERDRRRALVEHYLGGDDPAAALVRFLDACDDVIAARDAAQSVLGRAAPVTAERPAWPSIDLLRAGHPAAGDPRPAIGRALDRRPVHAADLAVPDPPAAPRRAVGQRRHRADDRQSVAASGFALLIPGLWGAVLAVLLTQLQMLWDASDGEVARWRGTSSPLGIFLDRVGHYLTESLIPIGLGVRAAGRLRRRCRRATAGRRSAPCWPW